ncbi:MAG: chromate transporter, partial [Waterburya sp.]
MTNPPQEDNQTKELSKITYSLGDIVLYMLKLGAIGFGGPIALVGYMHRDLVEQKQWIS